MNKRSWSIVIPYFNEQEYLESCLSCILQQIKKPDQIILVNNASTDGSYKISVDFKEKYKDDFDIILLDEHEQGKIFALMSGSSLVQTTHFAVWDADTFYPPAYIAYADEAYMHNHAAAAVMATSIKNTNISFKNWFRILKIQVLSRLYTSECHAGGYAETYNTKLYREVGGFDNKIWPYVFEDHEIVQRLLKVGKVLYPPKMWCVPSARRADRSRVTWTKKEKFIYRYTPFFLKDWFFYSFLGPRFERRGLNITRLREQPWKNNENS